MELSFFSSRQNRQHKGKIHSRSRTILLGKLRRMLLVALLVLILPMGVLLISNGSEAVPETKHVHDPPTRFVSAISPNNSSMKKNLTVVVPGFGDMSRMLVLKQSLITIKRSLESRRYGFDCLVYVYKQDILKKAIDELPFCQVQPNPGGLWTHHMKQVPPLDPTTFQTHVAVLMDDIDVFTHRLDAAHMLDRMEQKGYQMASSSFPRGSVHREGLFQRADCQSHETGYVDILFTIFDWKTWKCWQDHIDLEINPYGWGYDVLVGDLCGGGGGGGRQDDDDHAVKTHNNKIGVIDQRAMAIHVTHPCGGASGENNKEGGCRKSSYDTNTARRQMEAWIVHVAAKTRGHNLPVPSNTSEAYDYRASVLERWKQYPRCDDGANA